MLALNISLKPSKTKHISPALCLYFSYTEDVGPPCMQAVILAEQPMFQRHCSITVLTSTVFNDIQMELIFCNFEILRSKTLWTSGWGFLLLFE